MRKLVSVPPNQRSPANALRLAQVHLRQGRFAPALAALRAAYPSARLHGIEWSWPLRLACALRCPWAQVHQGDIWRADWQPYDLVYLFQRPESMPRALAKAAAQMRPGSWLVSLEFEATGASATHVIRLPDGRPVWMYRCPVAAAGAGAVANTAIQAHE